VSEPVHVREEGHCDEQDWDDHELDRLVAF
jgi:hypothetical protein